MPFGLHLPKFKIPLIIKNFMNAMILFINHFNKILPVSQIQPKPANNSTRIIIYDNKASTLKTFPFFCLLNIMIIQGTYNIFIFNINSL